MYNKLPVYWYFWWYKFLEEKKKQKQKIKNSLNFFKISELNKNIIKTTKLYNTLTSRNDTNISQQLYSLVEGWVLVVLHDDTWIGLGLFKNVNHDRVLDNISDFRFS